MASPRRTVEFSRITTVLTNDEGYLYLTYFYSARFAIATARSRLAVSFLVLQSIVDFAPSGGHGHDV